MIPTDVQQAGPSDDRDDAETARLLRSLDTLYTAHRLAPGMRERILRAALERAATPRRALPRWRSARLRLGSLATVLALVLSGSFAYTHLQGAAPVSAMSILQRAAAAHPAPDQVAHRTYSLWQTAASTNPYTSTVDVWLQTDATGATAHFAATQTETAGSGGPITAVSRVVIDGQTAQAYYYQPGDNTVRLSSGTPDTFLHGQPNLFDSASLARYLAALAQGSQRGARLLPPQTLDGAPVEVVQVDGYPDDPQERNIIAYIDARSYTLRGADFDFGKAGGVRLRSDETVALAALPPGTFAFQPPAGARVLSSTGQPAGTGAADVDPASSDAALKDYLAGDTAQRAFAAACSTSPDALRAAFGGGKTMLAICQATNPRATLPGLVVALAAPYRTKLEAAQATGAITGAQAGARLAALQARLQFLLVMPL